MARPAWGLADGKWFLTRKAQNTGSIFAKFKKVHKKSKTLSFSHQNTGKKNEEKYYFPRLALLTHPAVDLRSGCS
jgi:hypothetical protein